MRCRTGVPLRVLCIGSQQHMPCQRTARLVMVISLPDLLCCAWLLCMAALPVLHKIWWWKEEEEEEGERETGQPCASRKISTQMCAPTCTVCRAGDSAWIPPVPSQEKRENESARERESTSEQMICAGTACLC